MLHYKVYQNNSKNSKLKGKWFARAAVIDTIVFNLLYPFLLRNGISASYWYWDSSHPFLILRE